MLPLCAHVRAENARTKSVLSTTEKRRFIRIYPPIRAVAYSECRNEELI
jgi:hypothetical protein